MLLLQGVSLIPHMRDVARSRSKGKLADANIEQLEPLPLAGQADQGVAEILGDISRDKAAASRKLLTFPHAARGWLDKIYPWERRAMRVARPVLQPLIDVPLPKDEIFASLKDLLLDLDGMRKVLTDPAISTVRIVLNLEKMVVKEAKRAFSYLSLFGYVTDAVVVHRVLPAEPHAALFKHWPRIHRRYPAEARSRRSSRRTIAEPLSEFFCFDKKGGPRPS